MTCVDMDLAPRPSTVSSWFSSGVKRPWIMWPRLRWDNSSSNKVTPIIPIHKLSMISYLCMVTSNKLLFTVGFLSNKIIDLLLCCNLPLDCLTCDCSEACINISLLPSSYWCQNLNYVSKQNFSFSYNTASPIPPVKNLVCRKVYILCKMFLRN